jgi:hypothetical protein
VSAGEREFLLLFYFFVLEGIDVLVYFVDLSADGPWLEDRPLVVLVLIGISDIIEILRLFERNAKIRPASST